MENREVFATWDRQRYADWLDRCLRSYYACDRPSKNSSFGPFANIFYEQESLTEALATIYHKYIADESKLFFRQSVGDVLRKWSQTGTGTIEGARDLVYLIARLHAEESVDALVPVFAASHFGKEHPDVLYEAIAAAEHLAPSKYAIKAILGLMNARNFDDGYLLEGLKILISCDPSDTAALVSQFMPRLNQLRTRVSKGTPADGEDFREALYDWVNHVACVPLVHVKELIQEVACHTENHWLIEILLTDQHSPFRIANNRLRTSWILLYAEKATPIVIPSDAVGLHRKIRISASVRDFVSAESRAVAIIPPPSVKPELPNLRHRLPSAVVAGGGILDVMEKTNTLLGRFGFPMSAERQTERVGLND